MEFRKKIEEGEWKSGERIPAERKLADFYQLSIGTVKKAILNLVQEGYLRRFQGKGTFVANTALIRESLRYYRMLRNFEDKEAELKIKLLSVITVKNKAACNRLFEIEKNQNLYKMDRIFTYNDEPIIYSISYLPQTMFKGLEKLPVNQLETITLYEALENRYGVTTVYNKELFGAVAADKTNAEVLEIQEGSPLLFIEMMSYTYKNTPYEYRKSYCLTNERRIFSEI